MRLLKGSTPDTGMGNRLSKLISFAGIGESLDRHVLAFWATPGNTNMKAHRGRRFYGGLDEVRSLMHLPRALHWTEDWSDEALNGTSSGSALEKVALEAADLIPTGLLRGLEFGWGHPEGTWFYWQCWAHQNKWPSPCVDRVTFFARMRDVYDQIRPRTNLSNPPPRSYLVLHWRRGDRGNVALSDPGSYNLTWTCAQTLITRRADLPWLVVADNATAIPEIEAQLMQRGARIVERTPSQSAEGSVRPVIRDFFAMSASVGILFSGARFGRWIDSSFSSMAAFVGDVPLLFPHPTAKGGNIAQMQALGNESGAPLRTYFFADQVDGFIGEVAKAQERPFASPRVTSSKRTEHHAEQDPHKNGSCASRAHGRTTAERLVWGKLGGTAVD